MRHIKDVLEEYNITKRKDRKKIQIIEWFQKHPGMRFDVSEVYASLGDDLNVGEGQIRNYLNELAEEDVLHRHGEKRIGYQLAGDIIIPARYQVRAVLRHLAAVFDTRRWGITGILTLTTAMWAVLTLPFWFLWASLVVYPMDSYGPLTRAEFLWMAISMTLWLVVFVAASIVLYRGHRWYQQWSGWDLVNR